jgi:EAL domain-containing protein (putative c-di-GMP-specific phosphodiesterase class I)
MSKEKLNWTLSGNEGPEDPHGVRRITVSDLGVVFQPIVDVSNGKTFAHEALVRCKRPEYAAPPVLFERAVEENACGRLGRLIREVAFSTCGDVPLFVNLHPEELSSRWLVRPDDPLGFHSRPVFLEVTEAAAFTHFELCQGVLKELCRRTGALLVIDDFGAGYSNLERVVDLEPAIVKLDLALTRDVHRRRRGRRSARRVEVRPRPRSHLRSRLSLGPSRGAAAARSVALRGRGRRESRGSAGLTRREASTAVARRRAPETVSRQQGTDGANQ